MAARSWSRSLAAAICVPAYRAANFKACCMASDRFRGSRLLRTLIRGAARRYRVETLYRSGGAGGTCFAAPERVTPAPPTQASRAQLHDRSSLNPPERALTEKSTRRSAWLSWFDETSLGRQRRCLACRGRISARLYAIKLKNYSDYKNSRFTSNIYSRK